MHADSINITGLYAVMSDKGEHVQFTGSIEQARRFKRHLIQQYPEKSFGLFEMKGAWESMEKLYATGYVLRALKEYTT